MSKCKKLRDCPVCKTPLLTLQGFENVVVKRECVECDWKTPMRELVEAVMATLWERRPYKHALADFQGSQSGGYEEMLQEMESYAADVFKKFGTKFP